MATEPDNIQNNITTEENSSSQKKITFFKDAPEYRESSQNTEAQTETATPAQPESQSSQIEKVLSAMDEEIKQLEPTDAEQIETIVYRYIKLLDPADKYYLKYQQVYDNGEKYIAYLKSPEYVQYKKDRKSLESKYSNNKKYTVEVMKKKVYVYKKDAEGKTDRTAKVDELARPTYINLIDIFDKSHKNITQTRLKLKNLYNQLMNRPFVKVETKNKFIKQRDSMISKLNDFYSIQYFYNKVNGIVQTEKHVGLPKISYYYSENKQEIVPRLVSKEISVPNDDLQLLYDNGAKKLELYNKIQELIIANTDKKEVQALIKQYINFDEEQQRELLYKIEKKKNHQLITYMVIPAGIEVPADNSIISPRDLRPFFAMHKKSSQILS
jgi:hypothetical protein